MITPTPSSLSPDALARRLAELVADERAALVDFLLHLEEFDRRRAWAEAGYDSLWSYCQRVLHLREGPAGGASGQCVCSGGSRASRRPCAMGACASRP